MKDRPSRRRERWSTSGRKTKKAGQWLHCSYSINGIATSDFPGNSHVVGRSQVSKLGRGEWEARMGGRVF